MAEAAWAALPRWRWPAILPWAEPLARRREAVAGNLLRLGEADPAAVDLVFASYGRYWAESLRLPRLSRGEIVAGVRREGWHHLDGALAGGKGAIAALPHLGGWDWGGAYLAASGYRASVVVEGLRPPELLAWFAGLRRRVGLEVITVGTGAATASLRSLAANRVVCLLADRVVEGVAGVDVELFGAPARLPAGPVSLALRAGAPLLPAAVYFDEATGSHLAVVRPPLRLQRLGRFRDDVRRGTQVLASELEALIGAAPVQWHVLAPVWAANPRPARASAQPQPPA